MLNQTLVTEKMKLLEARQARDWAEANIRYHEVRLESIRKDLEELQYEKVNSGRFSLNVANALPPVSIGTKIESSIN